MSYRLSSLAEQDLEEIWFYVAEDASPTTADRLIDAIFNRFEMLVEQPRMGRNRQSSATAFARSSSRATSSTIDTMRIS
jgi:plasmid stabilization system protein ParE